MSDCADERENFKLWITMLTCTNYAKLMEMDKMEDALKKAEEKLERLVVDAAVAKARLSDLRAKSK